jgi:hypothetical protein
VLAQLHPVLAPPGTATASIAAYALERNPTPDRPYTSSDYAGDCPSKISRLAGRTQETAIYAREDEVWACSCDRPSMPRRGATREIPARNICQSAYLPIHRWPLMLRVQALSLGPLGREGFYRCISGRLRSSWRLSRFERSLGPTGRRTRACGVSSRAHLSHTSSRRCFG